MTKDDIIDMAKEAAAKHGHTFKEEPNDAVLEIIAEAYAMGASAEREACAVICDNRVLYTGYDCAAAIRGRDVYKMGWPVGDPRDILKSAKPRSSTHDQR